MHRAGRDGTASEDGLELHHRHMAVRKRAVSILFVIVDTVLTVNVAAFRYSVCFVPDKLVLYTRHGDNASTASAPSSYSLFSRIRFRWEMIVGVLRLMF